MVIEVKLGHIFKIPVKNYFKKKFPGKVDFEVKEIKLGHVFGIPVQKIGKASPPRPRKSYA